MKRTLLIVSIRVGDAVDRNNLEAKTAGSSDWMFRLQIIRRNISIAVRRLQTQFEIVSY